MADGLTGFKQILEEFRGLSSWAVGGAVAVPFVAALADLAPPWPKGIVVTTAILELVALVLVYQLLRTAPKKRIDRTLLGSAALLALSSLIYLAALSFFVYEVPNDGGRWVKGFVCTADAQAVFAARCPFLGMDELRTAEFEAERLWTAWSV